MDSGFCFWRFGILRYDPMLCRVELFPSFAVEVKKIHHHFYLVGYKGKYTLVYPQISVMQMCHSLVDFSLFFPFLAHCASSPCISILRCSWPKIDIWLH